MGPLLFLFPENYTQRFPWAASERSPHPTNGTPNLIHLLVIWLGQALTLKKNRISLPFSLQYNHLSTKGFILRLFWPFSPIFHPHTTGNSLNFNFNNFTLMKIWNLDLSHHDHIKTELLTLLSKHHPKIADRLLKGCSNTITNLNIKE